MKKKFICRTKMIAGCLIAFLAAGCMMLGNRTVAQAFPSKGTSVSGNIRVRDDANGNPTGSLEAGQEVSISDEKQSSDGYTWYEITYTQDGAQTTGWVRGDLLNTDGSDDGQNAGEDDAEEPENDAEEPENDTEEPENDAEEPEDDAQEPEENDPEKSGADSDAVFQLEGEEYGFAESIPEDGIPKDFSAATVTYAGELIPAVKFDHADLFLFYLCRISDPSDQDFYIYDSERDSILPYVKKKTGNGYVIFTNAPEAVSESISGTYTMSQCDFKAGSVVAYQQSEAADNVSADVELSDFYYIYGVSDTGEAGWYLYDSEKGSVQRSVANMSYSASAQQDGQKAVDIFDADSTMRMIVGAMGVLCILLLILVIIFSFRYKRIRRMAESELEEEEDEDEEEYRMEEMLPEEPVKVEIPEEKPAKEEEMPAKPAKKQKKSLRKQEKSAEQPREAAAKMLEVEIPGGKVDMMDLDAEMEYEEHDGYDMDVLPGEDYDLTQDNTPEDEAEFDRLSRMLEAEISGESERFEKSDNSGEEPEYYDDEEEPELPAKEGEDDELEFL